MKDPTASPRKTSARPVPFDLRRPVILERRPGLAKGSARSLTHHELEQTSRINERPTPIRASSIRTR
jgi:hypothetical protein